MAPRSVWRSSCIFSRDVKRLTTIVCSLMLLNVFSCFAQDLPVDASDTAFHYLPSIESIRLDATFSMLFSVGANVDVNFFEKRKSKSAGHLLGLRIGSEIIMWTMHDRVPSARDVHVLLRAGTYSQHTRWDVFAGIAHRATFEMVSSNLTRSLPEWDGLVLKAGVETSRILLHPVIGVHARVSLVYGKRATESFLDYAASIGVGINLGWQRDHSSISP